MCIRDSVCTDDLAKGGSAVFCVWIFSSDFGHHIFKAVDFGSQFFASRLRPFKTKAELKILLIANEYIGAGGYLPKCCAERFLSAFPEGSTIIEVKANLGAIGLGSLCHFKAAACGILAHGGDKAGNVKDADTLPAENSLDVKVREVKRPADLTGPVVPHAGSAQALSLIHILPITS